MNLETLKYYIDKETGKIVQIFINTKDFDRLLEQIGNIKVYINVRFDLKDIHVYRNLYVKANYAQFVILDGDPEKDKSYSDYMIEILTEDEKIIRDILE